MESETRVDDYSTTLDALLSSNASVEDLTRSLFDYGYAKTLQDDPQLAEMMRACSIPTSLDSEVIGVLRNAPKQHRTNKRILADLSKFNFVITRKDGRFVYHDSTRDILLREWRSRRNRKQYDVYVKRLVDFYKEKARKHRNKKEYQRALANLNLVTEFHPKDGNLYFQMGLMRFELQDYRAALIDFTKAIRLQSRPAEVYEWRAAAYFRLNNHAAAILDYGKAIRLQPEVGSNFQGRGMSYFNLETYEEAISDFTRAIELDPKEAPNYYWRGASHSRLKQYKQAIVDFTKAIKLDPRDMASHQWRGLLNYELKKYKQALLDFKRAIRIQPSDTFSYNWLGLIHLELQDQKSALLNFTEAIKLGPEEGGHYYNRAVTYFVRGQYKEALADVARAIKLKPTEPRHFSARGRIKYGQMKYRSARNDFDRATKLGSKDAADYYFGGLCNLSTGQESAALRSLADAVRYDARERRRDGKHPTRDPQFTFWRGIARHGLGQLDEAYADWRLAKISALKSEDRCVQQRALALIALVEDDPVTAQRHYVRAFSKICRLITLRMELGYLDQLSRLFPSLKGVRDTRNWFRARLQSKV